MNKRERLQEIQDRKKQIVEEVYGKKSRYILTMDMYIYAEDHEDAMRIANDIVDKEKSQYDNQAAILSVHTAPTGMAHRAQIYPKTT